jgi:hypothetical protein
VNEDSDIGTILTRIRVDVMMGGEILASKAAIVKKGVVKETTIAGMMVVVLVIQCRRLRR